MDVPYHGPDASLLAVCRCESLAARGPGGQHANRNATGVRLQFKLPDGETLVAVADNERSHARNQAAALRQMRLQLACHLRGLSDPEWLRPHRHGRRLRVSAGARDLHLVAAVLLDALDDAEGQPSSAARALDLGSRQFVGGLTCDKRLWQAAQQLRERHGLGPLRTP
ncbi:MAG: peptide chain release factor family protein [Planctomycetota bacterium]